MATHSSILTGIIPWTEEPGRLQSMGSQRVGQDRAYIHIHMCVCVYIHRNIFNVYFKNYFWSHGMACRILDPPLETEPIPGQRKCRFLTTGPPGNSLILKNLFYF